MNPLSYNVNNESLSFSLGRLISLVNQHKDQLLDLHLEPFDITAAQFRVLVAVHLYEMNSPAEVSKYLNIDAGSMTRMLGRLIKKELIVKVPNTKDKRSVFIKLTTQGNSILIGCMKSIDEDKVPSIAGDLSPQEIEQLIRLLTRLLP